MPVTALLSLQIPAARHVTTGSTWLELSKGFKMVTAQPLPSWTLLPVLRGWSGSQTLRSLICSFGLYNSVDTEKEGAGQQRWAHRIPQIQRSWLTCGRLLPGSAVSKTPPAGSVGVTVGSLKIFLRVFFHLVLL